MYTDCRSRYLFGNMAFGNRNTSFVLVTGNGFTKWTVNGTKIQLYRYRHKEVEPTMFQTKIVHPRHAPGYFHTKILTLLRIRYQHSFR